MPADPLDQLEQWAQQITSIPNPNETILAYFCPTNRARLSHRRKRLERLVASRPPRNATAAQKGKHSRLIGLTFEHLIRGLLHDCKVFTYESNIRTTVGEVDFLMKIGSFSNFVPMLKASGTHFVGEAKCYTKGPKKEWIDELAGFLDIHDANLGILFLGTKSKKLGSDFRKAVSFHCIAGKKILPFGWHQLDKIKDGSNLLSVLSDLYVDVAMHRTLKI